MKNYVPLEKRSKKAQKEYYSSLRRTWGFTDPVTKSVRSRKKYRRTDEKRRTAREINSSPGPSFMASAGNIVLTAPVNAASALFFGKKVQKRTFRKALHFQKYIK